MLSAFPSLLFSVVNAERGLSLIFALLVLLVWGEKKKSHFATQLPKLQVPTKIHVDNTGLAWHSGDGETNLLT